MAIQPPLDAGLDELIAQPAHGGTWRVTLRLPESLRTGVDAAARRDRLSVNAWLVRAVTAALGAPRRSRANTDKSFSGWVR